MPDDLGQTSQFYLAVSMCIRYTPQPSIPDRFISFLLITESVGIPAFPCLCILCWLQWKNGYAILSLFHRKPLYVSCDAALSRTAVIEQSADKILI